MKLFLLRALVCGCFVFVAQNAFAAGPHDMNCAECHSPHFAKGDYILGVEPGSFNNPATTRLNENITGIDALCLGCHNEEEGIAPVHLNSSHPTDVKPTYVNVPSQLLRGDAFGCISCHNPHPSNTNYRYLIVPTNAGADMGKFCVVCHPEQSDPEVQKAVPTQYNFDKPEEPRVKISQ